MTIHPAGTPLARVAIGEAIASLPYHTEQDIVTLLPSLTRHPSGQLEFVRFLTEQDGKRVHVWKRTR